jgi:uncharacterized protein (DUF983 family)
MGEFITAVAGGILIALFNKFVLSGTVCKLCETKTKEDDDDDGLSSSSSTITADIHVSH